MYNKKSNHVKIPDHMKKNYGTKKFKINAETFEEMNIKLVFLYAYDICIFSTPVTLNSVKKLDEYRMIKDESIKHARKIKLIQYRQKFKKHLLRVYLDYKFPDYHRLLFDTYHYSKIDKIKYNIINGNLKDKRYANV